MRNIRWLLYRFRELFTGRPADLGDHPLIDTFNDAKQRGLIAPDVTLSQIRAPRMAELDREAGIPPGH